MDTDWAETPGVQASFDLSEDVVHASVLEVYGWVAFVSGPAIRVTVYVDGAPVRARNAVPRPDLIPILGPLWAAAAGFAAIVEPDLEPGLMRLVHVAVRAEGANGERWETAERSVAMRRPLPSAAWRRALDGLVHTPVRPVRPGISRLKLCVFTHSLAIGGGQLWLQDLVLSLARSGAAQVRVVSPSDGALRAELESAGVTVHVTAGYPVDPALYEGRVTELATMLHAWDTDAVLVNTLGLLVPAEAAAVAGLPFVWAIHESFPLRTYAAVGWGQATLDSALEVRWRAVLAAGSLMFEADSTSEAFGIEVPAARRTTVRYNVDRSSIDDYLAVANRGELRRRLGIEPHRLVLLCMGVFEPRKAEVSLLHAFAPIARRYPDALLLLVGAHPSHYTDAVASMVDELDLHASVRVIPIDNQPYDWYAVSDVLVSASDIESLPRSMLEAMAFGLPVAAAEVFGVGELIQDGETGWLFEARDIGALTTALRRVLDTPAAELEAMAERAILRSSEFGKADYAMDMLRLLASDAREGA